MKRLERTRKKNSRNRQTRMHSVSTVAIWHCLVSNFTIPFRLRLFIYELKKIHMQTTLLTRTTRKLFSSDDRWFYDWRKEIPTGKIIDQKYCICRNRKPLAVSTVWWVHKTNKCGSKCNLHVKKVEWRATNEGNRSYGTSDKNEIRATQTATPATIIIISEKSVFYDCYFSFKSRLFPFVHRKFVR